MTGIEMRNFESPFDPDDSEMSAQERLLYNNNHPQHSNSPLMMQHHPNGGGGGGGVLDENHYQIPYAHLLQNCQQPYNIPPQQQTPLPPSHHNHYHQQQPPQTPTFHHNHQQQHPQQQQQQQPSHLNYQQGCGSSIYNSNDLLNTIPHQQQNHHHNMVNGNGSSNGYSTGYRDKYSLANPVREENAWRQHNRSQHGGSGKVYRSRRKIWWMAMVFILLLIILAGAVVITIYFTVLKQDPDSQATVSNNGDSADHHDDNNDNSNYNNNNNNNGPWNNVTEGTSGIGDGGYGVEVPTDTSPSRPSYSIPPPDHNNNNNHNNHNNHNNYNKHRDGNHYPDFVNVKVQKFDAYWHPGDSRLFSSVLTNGTVIQAFGPKKSDGTAKSIYSLSITDVDGVTKSVRFLGQTNLASVILPSGVIVHYDWSSNNIDMEVKIYEPRLGHGEGPISHLARVDVGVRAYLLRQISKAMMDARNRNDRPLVGNRPGSTKCFSRFPIKVSKCGGQYPYDGAFVTGEITGIDKPITMSALPWPKEPDPCYTHSAGPLSNYYLPLPGQVDNDNATMIKDAYAASSAGLFTDLCNIMNDQVYKERHDLCSDMANKVMKALSRQQLPNIVYDSCSTIINTLHVACSAISGISSADNMPSLTVNGLLRSLSRRLSDSFPPDLPKQVELKAHAFCPSSLPLTSFESTVSIQTIRGNVVEDAIHVNCPDYPEVTYVDLHHLLTTSAVMSSDSSYDIVKHKMRVCSICAFEKEVSAQVVSDEMLCNNTCTRSNVMEQIPGYYNKEERQFVDQDSVYCHEFLTSVENRMDPIGKKCLGNCMSHLHVQFKIEDPNTKTVYYDQTVQCSEHRRHSCKMKFGR